MKCFCFTNVTRCWQAMARGPTVAHSAFLMQNGTNNVNCSFFSTQVFFHQNIHSSAASPTPLSSFVAQRSTVLQHSFKSHSLRESKENRKTKMSLTCEPLQSKHFAATGGAFVCHFVICQHFCCVKNKRERNVCKWLLCRVSKLTTVFSTTNCQQVQLSTDRWSDVWIFSLCVCQDDWGVDEFPPQLLHGCSLQGSLHSGCWCNRRASRSHSKTTTAHFNQENTCFICLKSSFVFWLYKMHLLINFWCKYKLVKSQNWCFDCLSLFFFHVQTKSEVFILKWAKLLLMKAYSIRNPIILTHMMTSVTLARSKS